MPNALKQRSGRAVVSYCRLLGWKPELVVQVGVGIRCDEARMFAEEWPGVQIFGFEPHPSTFRALHESYPGLLQERAVSDRLGIRELSTKPGHADGSSMHGFSDGRQVPTYPVCTTTLDFVFRDPSREILLWLDCEGSEVEALRGGREFLRSVGVVNVELTGRPPGAGWGSPLEVHRLLREAGFYHAWTHTTRSKGGQADAIYVRRDLFDPTLCCCPAEIERYEERSKG